MPVRDGAMPISWSYGGEWNCETRKLQTRGTEGFLNSKDKNDGVGISQLGGLIRRFIPNFTETAAPLSDLTRKKAAKEVQWNA